MYTDWNCPSPRPGIKGWLDRITGPEATTVELLLQFIPPLFFLKILVSHLLREVPYRPN